MSSADRRNEAVLDAVADLVTLDVGGCGSVGLQVVDAGLVAAMSLTVVFEASINGIDFVALNMVPSNSATAATSTTAAGCWSANCGGYKIVQARVSAYTAGGAKVTLQSAASGGK